MVFMQNHDNITDVLKRYGLKNTLPRQQILTVLSAHDQPITVEDISRLIGKKSPDIVTVYRNLSTFKENKLVNEVSFKDGAIRYELNTDGEHCHHAVCTSCGIAEHIHDVKLEHALDLVTSKLKLFNRVKEHSLEFFGLCKKCTTLNKHA
jgi:Fur family transcriptional regulator, ferric uptake regulator